MKVIYFLLIITVAGIAFAFFRMFSHGELAEKPMYAALQAAELKHRGKAEAGIVLEERDGLALAGFSSGSKDRTWVVLNALRSSGNLFVIPESGERLIPCQLVGQLSNSSVTISPDVKNILASSCAK
ncbi:hypothetical protein [[Pseudomonas] boreopolis]|uniref:hypothetical protein n=1 Tax=Xanthomonas boreopolis TaxID=86183 RepID=UPI003D9ADBA7